MSGVSRFRSRGEDNRRLCLGGAEKLLVLHEPAELILCDLGSGIVGIGLGNHHGCLATILGFSLASERYVQG